MQQLIIGYGYCGYYLANELLKENHPIAVVSRHLDERFKLQGINHIQKDITKPLDLKMDEAILYYLVPPLEEGNNDQLLSAFLQNLDFKPKKIIYFGSTAVYGNHHGAWVNEKSSCHIVNRRQERRLDAEKQWFSFAKKLKIDACILRVAGIYGPGRLPIQAALDRKPLINPNEAPFSNHIYVKDLVKIAASLAQREDTRGIYNIADGFPEKMGTLQASTSKILGLEKAEFQSLKEGLDKASPRLREFIEASKRLDISAIRGLLGEEFEFRSLEEGIRESL